MPLYGLIVIFQTKKITNYLEGTRRLDSNIYPELFYPPILRPGIYYAKILVFYK